MAEELTIQVIFNGKTEYERQGYNCQTCFLKQKKLY